MQCGLYCTVMPYSRKFSREKTFMNFAVLEPSVKVFSTKFGGRAVSNYMIGFSIPRNFSPWNDHFFPIHESFLPRKFPAIYTVLWSRWIYPGHKFTVWLVGTGRQALPSSINIWKKKEVSWELQNYIGPAWSDKSTEIIIEC